MRTAPAPISDEVAHHRLRLHACPGFKVYEVPCPCGLCVALCCVHCDEAILVATAPGTFCEHAQWLTEDADGEGA